MRAEMTVTVAVARKPLHACRSFRFQEIHMKLDSPSDSIKALGVIYN